MLPHFWQLMNNCKFKLSVYTLYLQLKSKNHWNIWTKIVMTDVTVDPTKPGALCQVTHFEWQASDVRNNATAKTTMQSAAKT